MTKKSELDRYLEAESEDVLNLDLLMWWKSSGSKYKILSLMARDALSILVTTVASESTFSTLGRVLDNFPRSLKPRVVEGLICTQDWLRAIHMPVDVEECIENAEKFESNMDCLTEDIIVGLCERFRTKLVISLLEELCSVDSFLGIFAARRHSFSLQRSYILSFWIFSVFLYCIVEVKPF